VGVVQLVIGESGDVLATQTVYSTGTMPRPAPFPARRPIGTGSRGRGQDACVLSRHRAGGTALQPGHRGLTPDAPLKEAIAAWAQQAGLALPMGQDGWSPWLAAAESARQGGKTAAELAARVMLAEADLRPDAEQLASIDRGLVVAQDASLPRPCATPRGFCSRPTAWTSSPPPGSPAASPCAIPAAIPRCRRWPRSRRLPPIRWRATPACCSPCRAVRCRPTRPMPRPCCSAWPPTRTCPPTIRCASSPCCAWPTRASQGQLDEAQRLFAQTGLTQEQCALIGPKPALTAINTGSTAFPMDAARWGFEGWVRSEYDILADGHTAGLRAVASYPPFVFDDAAHSMLAKARYQASYRPENGAACSANRETIRFNIPGNTMVAKEIKKKS
jgi:hypothetical protein